MVLGRFAHQTGFGSFVALVLLTPVTAITYGAVGALAGICVVVADVREADARATGLRCGATCTHTRQRLLFDQDGTDDRAGPAVESEGRA